MLLASASTDDGATTTGRIRSSALLRFRNARGGAAAARTLAAQTTSISACAPLLWPIHATGREPKCSLYAGQPSRDVARGSVIVTN